MKKFFSVLLILFVATLPNFGHSQPLTISVAFSAQELVENMLFANSNITVTNITSSTGSDFGSVNGLGHFANTNQYFDIPSGVVLSSGNVMDVPGPNLSLLSGGNYQWFGDSDITEIINTATGQNPLSHNATKLEFDFTSLNNILTFNFLYASEEYGAFQCGQIDGIAFLLTDLVSGITTNLAVVPDTTIRVSNVTVRDDPNAAICPNMNQQYFDSYFFGESANFSPTNFNWQTHSMAAFASIVINHPYHIKFVISDTSDFVLDSAVFIETGSFGGSLSIGSFIPENVALFPNPATSRFQLISKNLSPDFEKIVIYNTLGNVVSTFFITSPTQTSFDVSLLSKGLYIVEITNVDKQKLLKKLLLN